MGEWFKLLRHVQRARDRDERGSKSRRQSGRNHYRPLDFTRGRKSKAADILGISRKALLEKRKRYGLD